MLLDILCWSDRNRCQVSSGIHQFWESGSRYLFDWPSSGHHLLCRIVAFCCCTYWNRGNSYGIEMSHSNCEEEFYFISASEFLCGWLGAALVCCCGFIKKGLIVDLLCILDISSVSLSSNTQKLSSSSGVWLVCSLDEVEKELRED